MRFPIRNSILNSYVCLALILGLTITRTVAQTYDGWTFYAPQNGTKAYLVDMAGLVYHSWTFPSTAKTTYSSYLLPDGSLLRSVNKSGNSFNGGPISGQVQRVDWNGTVLWDYIYSTTQYCSHHDICPMPNGNVLLIAYELKTAAQVSAAGCTQSITMWPDKIVEIQPVGANGGNVVWEWHAWDHLVQQADASKPNYGIVADHPELLNINYKTTKDWMHMNGLDYNETLDQIAFSSHNLNEIYVIDHSTTTAEAASHSGGNSGKGGDLLYRWGNPLAYNMGGTANFNTVHDAHWISSSHPTYPDHLCGYNNQGGAGGKTCIDIIDPPYAGFLYSWTAGAPYAPATYSFRHTYSGSPSSNNGNSQQLPNGNMLVTIGLSGYVYEINSAQTVVWSKSTGGTVAQCWRYPYSYLTAINDPINEEIKTSIWPNPSSGIFYVETNLKENETGTMVVTDMTGKVVLNTGISNEINLSNQESGLYFLRISSPNKGTVTRKLNLY